ncbi:MAG: MoxR family ATPase [Nitrospirota bacterium]
MISKDINSFEKVEMGGKIINVPYPTDIPAYKFIGRERIIEKALAAWTCIDGTSPLNFRLYGPPGIGKNALVYELARILNKDLYIINGHEELGPEDIACSATMTSKNTIEYVASPLFAAMLRGGIFFFDEIGKAPQSALDPLASVLDDRRSLTSVLAGIRLKAHPDFLCCAALNEDEETGIGLPGFIDERTRPAIYVGYPYVSEIDEILMSRMKAIPDAWMRALLSDFKHVNLSARNTLTLLQFAYGLSIKEKGISATLSENEIKEYLSKAYKHIKDGDEDQKKEHESNLKKSSETYSAGLFAGHSAVENKETVH